MTGRELLARLAALPAVLLDQPVTVEVDVVVAFENGRIIGYRCDGRFPVKAMDDSGPIVLMAEDEAGDRAVDFDDRKRLEITRFKFHDRTGRCEHAQ